MYSIVSQSTPIQHSDVQTLILRIKNQVCAGFPSPAEDLGAERIDLSKVLIKHPGPAQHATAVDEDANHADQCAAWPALRVWHRAARRAQQATWLH